MEVLIDIERSVPKTNTYSPMLTERAWKEELAENTVEIIRLGDIAVGSIAYEEKSPNHIYISGIIVRPEYQGRGIATNATQSVLKKYPDAERIDLVTHPENPALKLYESLGFKVEERKENYWGDGEPRLVLARTK
ncbi:MAG: acetyltransferase [Parcubacteria group bacterium]|nr:acetyltransferase [Parcubacteria group bacterium]